MKAIALTPQYDLLFLTLNGWLQSKFKITLAQFLLLQWLDSQTKDVTMTELAKTVGHSTACATTLADRLEKLGYLERTHCPEDRRKIFVSLTKEGDMVLTKAVDMYQLIAGTL